MAVSRLRCATEFRHRSHKDVLRCLEAEDGAGPCVEAVCDPVEVALAVDGAIDTLGQVLADKAIEVLIGRPLPGAVRIAELERHAKPTGQFLVAGHLLALIKGEAPARHLRPFGEGLGEAVQCRLRPAILHLGDQGVAALALDQPADGAGIACTLDEVALPIARNEPIHSPDSW